MDLEFPLDDEEQTGVSIHARTYKSKPITMREIDEIQDQYPSPQDQFHRLFGVENRCFDLEPHVVHFEPDQVDAASFNPPNDEPMPPGYKWYLDIEKEVYVDYLGVTGRIGKPIFDGRNINDQFILEPSSFTLPLRTKAGTFPFSTKDRVMRVGHINGDKGGLVFLHFDLGHEEQRDRNIDEFGWTTSKTTVGTHFANTMKKYFVKILSNSK
jgi:hypothetical protein